MNSQELSEATIDVLARHGWTQGTITDDQGRYCLYGAAFHAAQYMANITEDNVADLTAFREWTSEIGQLIADQRASSGDLPRSWPKHPMAWILSFNDRPEATVEDVVLLLKRHAHG